MVAVTILYASRPLTGLKISSTALMGFEQTSRLALATIRSFAATMKHAVKTFPSFHGKRRLITVFTRALDRS